MPTRPELLRALSIAAQRSATDGIFFHQAVAERLGLHVSDLRGLSLLADGDARTAGEMARATGLTTGAVTRLIDRLEAAGYVRRGFDPDDRRRVVVKGVPQRMRAVGESYSEMAEAWRQLLSEYSDAELRLFLKLFDGMHEMSRRQIAALAERPSSRRSRS